MLRRWREKRAIMILDDQHAFVKAKEIAKLFGTATVFELNGQSFKTWWEGKTNHTVVAGKKEAPVISSISFNLHR